ncbi:MAG: hypothetical protein WC551_06100 [Patescibacteria group bacterium]
MLVILECILIVFLTVGMIVLGGTGLATQEQYKGKKNLAWKVVWGLRLGLGNLMTLLVLFITSALCGPLTFSVFCISLIAGMLIASFVYIMLGKLRIPKEPSPNIGPYRSLVKAPPRAFPGTLPRKIHVFLLNYFRPGWDDTAPSTEKV